MKNPPTKIVLGLALLAILFTFTAPAFAQGNSEVAKAERPAWGLRKDRPGQGNAVGKAGKPGKSKSSKKGLFGSRGKKEDHDDEDLHEEESHRDRDQRGRREKDDDDHDLDHDDDHDLDHDDDHDLDHDDDDNDGPKAAKKEKGSKKGPFSRGGRDAGGAEGQQPAARGKRPAQTGGGEATGGKKKGGLFGWTRREA